MDGWMDGWMDRRDGRDGREEGPPACAFGRKSPKYGELSLNSELNKVSNPRMMLLGP